MNAIIEHVSSLRLFCILWKEVLYALMHWPFPSHFFCCQSLRLILFHIYQVKVREVMSLPSTATSSHAREFDLERRIPLQGPVEMNGPDGEGVNVSLSLSSRAYGSVTANEPLGSLLPHSLSISSSHYNQVT